MLAALVGSGSVSTGTLALWFALATGIATIAAYARALALQKEGGPAYESALLLGRRLYYAHAAAIVVATRALADEATECAAVKHPMSRGILGRWGVEY